MKGMDFQVWSWPIDHPGCLLLWLFWQVQGQPACYVHQVEEIFSFPKQASYLKQLKLTLNVNLPVLQVLLI